MPQNLHDGFPHVHNQTSNEQQPRKLEPDIKQIFKFQLKSHVHQGTQTHIKHHHKHEVSALAKRQTCSSGDEDYQEAKIELELLIQHL